MQFDSTTLASTVSVLLEAMRRSYNFDARPVLEDLGMDLSRIEVPGARLPDAIVEAAWEELHRRTGDDCIGLAIGRYVRREDDSLQEVAFLLGFSDQSNFSRAFRRWTGKSPKAWRDAAKP